MKNAARLAIIATQVPILMMSQHVWVQWLLGSAMAALATLIIWDMAHGRQARR